MKDYKTCERYIEYKGKKTNWRCMYETPTIEEMEKAKAGNICFSCDPKLFIEMTYQIQKKYNKGDNDE